MVPSGSNGVPVRLHIIIEVPNGFPWGSKCVPTRGIINPNLQSGVWARLLAVKYSPWALPPAALAVVKKWVAELKLTRDSGPIPRRFLQIKSGTRTRPRKMKAHQSVVAITNGMVSAVSAWMGDDGKVLRPEFASYVGKYTTVVREMVSRTIDIDVSSTTQ